MEKELVRTKINYVLLGFLVLFISLFLWQVTDRQEIVEKTVIQHDTIILRDTIRYKVEIPVEEYVYTERLVRDTVWIVDEPKTYKDSTDKYNIEINATKLYGYNLNLYNNDTIIIYKEKIVERKKDWRDYVGFSAGFGVQYGLIGRQIDVGPYVGVCVKL